MRRARGADGSTWSGAAIRPTRPASRRAGGDPARWRRASRRRWRWTRRTSSTRARRSCRSSRARTSSRSGACRRRSASPRCGSDTRSRRARWRRSSTGAARRRRSPRPQRGSRRPRCARRLDVETEVSERERMRDALIAAGFDCRRSHANFVYVRVDDGLAARLEAQGLVVRRYARDPDHAAPPGRERPALLAALGAEPGSSSSRSALVVRTTRGDVAPDLARARRAAPVAHPDGRRLPRPPARPARVPRRARPGGAMAGASRRRRAPHGRRRDGGARRALRDALGSREGLTRYGSATVPMDDARATAAVDLVRRRTPRSRSRSAATASAGSR